MLLLRRLICVLFAAAYIVTAPALILYSLGYIYSPIAQELIHTGVLHLASSPAGADVYLGSSRFADQTPVTIKELLPGRYHVTRREVINNGPIRFS